MWWSSGRPDRISFAARRMKDVVEYSDMQSEEAKSGAAQAMLHQEIQPPSGRQTSDCCEYPLVEGEDGEISRSSGTFGGMLATGLCPSPRDARASVTSGPAGVRVPLIHSARGSGSERDRLMR